MKYLVVLTDGAGDYPIEELGGKTPIEAADIDNINALAAKGEIGIIEKHEGKFPTWLCSEQVRVLPVSEKFQDCADAVYKELRKNGIDATVDSRSERLGYKLRQAQLDRLPYMLVVGNKEQEENTVSVRSRFAGDEGSRPLADFIADICEEIRTKTIRKEEPKDDGKDGAK